MPTVKVHLECPVDTGSFRVQQVGSMFDVPLHEKVGTTFEVEVPGASEDWQIGAVVGPSGSGKSSVATEGFGEHLYTGEPWPRDKAVIDGFPAAMPFKEVTGLLTAVGFSSPPAWLRPYRVLSNGEKFRCDLARALVSDRPFVAFDEFTSVVDRTVAKFGSAAVAKAIRGGKVKRRFVAVTCHYDVIEWLEPDWVLDMASKQLARGSVRRPEIRLEVARCTHETWRLFSQHHYLSSTIHQSAQCFVATWNGEPVALCAMHYTFGFKDYWRVHRIVVLPDYQGIGVGTRLMEECSQIYAGRGKRISITASHPSILRHCDRSPLWKLQDVKKTGNARQANAPEHNRPAVVSAGRAVATFTYVPPK